jgi:hypothetical protein
MYKSLRPNPPTARSESSYLFLSFLSLYRLCFIDSLCSLVMFELHTFDQLFKLIVRRRMEHITAKHYFVHESPKPLPYEERVENKMQKVTRASVSRTCGRRTALHPLCVRGRRSSMLHVSNLHTRHRPRVCPPP